VIGIECGHRVRSMLNANTVTSHMFRLDVAFRNIRDFSSHSRASAPSFKLTDFNASGDESQRSTLYHQTCNPTDHLTILSMLQPRQQLFDSKIIEVHFLGHLMMGEAVTIHTINHVYCSRVTQTQQNIFRSSIHNDESRHKE